MNPHSVEKIKIGLLIYALVLVVGYGPFFVRNMRAVKHQIEDQADMQPLPLLPRPPTLPADGLEYTAAEIKLTLNSREWSPLEFSQGQFSLQNKRQYILTIANIHRKPVTLLDLILQFPLPVEAQRIIFEQGIQGLSFEPMNGFAMSFGQISVNGCPATRSYRLRASNLDAEGTASIALVLTRPMIEESTPAGMPKDPWPAVNFIWGTFKYSARGKMVSGEYYAPFEHGVNDVFSLGEPRGKPQYLRKVLDVEMLPGTCMSGASLL